MLYVPPEDVSVNVDVRKPHERVFAKSSDGASDGAAIRISVRGAVPETKHAPTTIVRAAATTCFEYRRIGTMIVCEMALPADYDDRARLEDTTGELSSATAGYAAVRTITVGPALRNVLSF